MKRIKKKFKSVIIFIFSILTLLIFVSCSKQTAVDSFNLYKDSWENKEYEAMYNMLSKNSQEYISKEDFIERYTNIYSGIEADNIEINIKEDEETEENIEFRLKMNTLAGEIFQDNYEVKMVKEKREDEDGWFVDWNESLIFPQMEQGDRIRVETIEAKRGEIYDRFGNGLAINGLRYSIGIHPAQYENSDTQVLADLLDIDKSIINKKLDKNINPEHFVPIVKLSSEDKGLLEELLEIDGVLYQEVDERVYPGGEALGSLIGYIHPITAEELEEDEEGVYSATSLIGKAGLEVVYEETLRANDGKEIYISKLEDEEEIERIILAEKELEDGRDLNITIDTELQKNIYAEMNGDTGASSVINPITGEVLAMVSSPSYDPNLYTTYIPNTQKEKWEAMEVSPFENRFNKAYSPGSVFKILTSAIGLESNIIDPNEKINIQGRSWQKDSSWGDYKVTRVSDRLSSVDLNDALVYSDNIYFAMAALEIGAKEFIEASKKFGFNEGLPISYPIAKSQITNDENFENDILLADTGYGQGQVLMSPLHLSMVYSSVVNDGNIMEPLLEIEESQGKKVWKEKVLSQESKAILLNSLINVIEDKDGTASSAKIDGIKLAGKTGTAEFKLSQEDQGKENGWFVAMDVDEPEIVISMLIEGVEDSGGSSYVIPKVRNVIEFHLKAR